MIEDNVDERSIASTLSSIIELASQLLSSFVQSAALAERDTQYYKQSSYAGKQCEVFAQEQRSPDNG